MSHFIYLESILGTRYRSEVTSLGLGLRRFEMQKRLSGWGYEVSWDVCHRWLPRYVTTRRLKDASVAEFELHRDHVFPRYTI